MIGKTISHYEIRSKLGAGGMGVVYKAHDTTLGRDVALKFLPADLTGDDAARARFIHEARAAAALEHPNICTVYEVGEADGAMFIAMPLVEGESIREKIASGQVDVDEAIELALGVARGLSKAHTNGIVHRDIKPGNVLLTSDGVVKIVDFGLAKLATQTRLTKTGMTVGTVNYMSPEQARGDEVDHRTDVWALGAMLYEMLAGKLPFRGDADPAVVYSILNTDPEPVTGVRREVPVALEDVVERALAKDPAKRYETIDGMIEALETVREEARLGIDRRHYATLKRLKRRKRLMAGSAVMLVVTIAAVLLTTFFQRGQAIDSIAVLPLISLSEDPDDEIFADGTTGALIASFNQLREIEKVSARSASMRYKDTDKSAAEIGDELGVKAILTGTIQRDGERIHIAVEVVNTKTGEQLWSDSFDGRRVDILTLQGQIASAIASEFRVSMTPSEQSMLAVKREVDPEVFRATELGKKFGNEWTVASFNKAINYFNQAISIDSTYAPAHAGLSKVFGIIGRWGPSAIRPEYRQKSKDAALKALELDETSAEAHSSLARVLLDGDFNWDLADREHRRAVELNPDETLGAYATYLLWAGRFGESIAAAERVIERDPVSEYAALQLGFILMSARRYDAAIAHFQESIGIFPDDTGLKEELAWVLVDAGRFAEADSIYAELEMEFNAWQLARMGRVDEALAMVKAWNDSEHRDNFAYKKALVYGALGDKEKALEMLEVVFENRREDLLQINTDPELDLLRPDPRFQALMERAGIPAGELEYLYHE